MKESSKMRNTATSESNNVMNLRVFKPRFSFNIGNSVLKLQYQDITAENDSSFRTFGIMGKTMDNYNNQSPLEVLIAGCRAFDEKAQEVVYKKFYRKIFGIVYSLHNDVFISEEVTNDAFITAFSKISKLKKINSFESWLIGIAINHSRNKIRKIKTRSRELQPNEETLHFEGKNEEHDAHLALRQTIATLPLGYRKVLVLHDVHGFTHNEISRILGVDPGTSKSQLFKARRMAREQLTASGAAEFLYKTKEGGDQ